MLINRFVLSLIFSFSCVTTQYLCAMDIASVQQDTKCSWCTDAIQGNDQCLVHDPVCRAVAHPLCHRQMLLLFREKNVPLTCPECNKEKSFTQSLSVDDCQELSAPLAKRVLFEMGKRSVSELVRTPVKAPWLLSSLFFMTRMSNVPLAERALYLSTNWSAIKHVQRARAEREKSHILGELMRNEFGNLFDAQRYVKQADAIKRDLITYFACSIASGTVATVGTYSMNGDCGDALRVGVLVSASVLALMGERAFKKRADDVVPEWRAYSLDMRALPDVRAAARRYLYEEN